MFDPRQFMRGTTLNPRFAIVSYQACCNSTELWVRPARAVVDRRAVAVASCRARRSVDYTHPVRGLHNRRRRSRSGHRSLWVVALVRSCDLHARDSLVGPVARPVMGRHRPAPRPHVDPHRGHLAVEAAAPACGPRGIRCSYDPPGWWHPAVAARTGCRSTGASNWRHR